MKLFVEIIVLYEDRCGHDHINRIYRNNYVEITIWLEDRLTGSYLYALFLFCISTFLCSVTCRLNVWSRCRYEFNPQILHIFAKFCLFFLLLFSSDAYSVAPVEEYTFLVRMRHLGQNLLFSNFSFKYVQILNRALSCTSFVTKKLFSKPRSQKWRRNLGWSKHYAVQAVFRTCSCDFAWLSFVWVCYHSYGYAIICMGMLCIWYECNGYGKCNL